MQEGFQIAIPLLVSADAQSLQIPAIVSLITLSEVCPQLRRVLGFVVAQRDRAFPEDREIGISDQLSHERYQIKFQLARQPQTRDANVRVGVFRARAHVMAALAVDAAQQPQSSRADAWIACLARA